MLNDPCYRDAQEKSTAETNKEPNRTEILNFLLSKAKGETRYLEIGVRNPDDNYNRIVATEKYGVDPGIEYEANPVDYRMTSDGFYEALSNGDILYEGIQFDVVFIDGLHLAGQADRDIANSLKFIKNDGFVVLHDCNPPTEWHAREDYRYFHTPAGRNWNGTTWKAFLKWRFDSSVHSCCIDTDWGIGILSKKRPIGQSISECNPFYEYRDLEENRKLYLNLIGFDELKRRLSKE